jgi:hypothetical protein
MDSCVNSLACQGCFELEWTLFIIINKWLNFLCRLQGEFMQIFSCIIAGFVAGNILQSADKSE